MESTGFGQEPMAGSSQYEREPPGSIKGEKFIDLLESQCHAIATPMHGVTSNMQDFRSPPRYS